MSICIIVFICEISYFWEVISSSILYILDSTVKADDSVIPEASVDASDIPVALIRKNPQVSIVSLSYSQHQEGYVSPVFFRFEVQGGVS